MTAPVSTGCGPIDELLGGGLDRGTVTQVYGPPAAGKTNLALSAAVTTAAAGEEALYIDTEGFSSDRFEQLIRASVDDEAVDAVADRVLFSAVHDFEQQTTAVQEATDVADRVDLIVLDSATGFYRLERLDEPEEAEGETLRRVANQVAHLLGIARRHGLAVVITNQVFTDPEGADFRPLGGYTLAHWCGTILRLERYRGDARKLVLEKHRSQPTAVSTRVRITDAGFEPVEAEP